MSAGKGASYVAVNPRESILSVVVLLRSDRWQRLMNRPYWNSTKVDCRTGRVARRAMLDRAENIN